MYNFTNRLQLGGKVKRNIQRENEDSRVDLMKHKYAVVYLTNTEAPLNTNKIWKAYRMNFSQN